MGDTTIQKIRDTEDTGLTDSELNQLIDDSKTFIEVRWQSRIDSQNSNFTSDIEEQIQRYLTLHLAKMNEHELESDSVQDKSLSFHTPQGNIKEWLRNTRPGRSAHRLLQMIGAFTQAVPKTFR